MPENDLGRPVFPVVRGGGRFYAAVRRDDRAAGEARFVRVEPIFAEVIAIGETPMDLDRKLKIALDESRLLIFGA